MKEFDVIVSGARVAGSVLSTLLCEAGHRVLVLDRAKFPSDSLSTHFFRWPALQAFQRMGTYDAVQKAAPHLENMLNDIDGQIIDEPVKGQDGLKYLDQQVVDDKDEVGGEWQSGADGKGGHAHTGDAMGGVAPKYRIDHQNQGPDHGSYAEGKGN